MPRAGYSWRHVVISTHRSWLPGDARGFRNRGHRIHSSGDYESPPPKLEHAGLRLENLKWGEPVEIERELRATVGRAIDAALQAMKLEVVAVSVSGMHAHVLVELPIGAAIQKRIVGEC